MRNILVAIFAVLLCGCLENEASFDAINAGEIDVSYSNQRLMISSDFNEKFDSSKSHSIKSQDSNKFVLFFFTSTCGVCKEQIPILEELFSQNVRIYGILGDIPNLTNATKFIESNHIKMPIFYTSNARRFFANATNGVKGVPVIAVFKDGKLTQKLIGLIPKSVLLQFI